MKTSMTASRFEPDKRSGQSRDPSFSVKKRIGYRIFLVDGDNVSPLTKTAFDEFYFRRQAVLQACAGKTIDIATVVCRLEDAKLREIIRIYCQRFKVKGDGSLDEHYGQPRSPAPASATGTSRQEPKRVQDGSVPEQRLNGRDLAQSLTMISSAAQKKILDVLRL